MTIRPFIAALCGVLLLTACTPAAPETVGEPASKGSQISSEPLEVVCDDPDAPPELTAEAEDKALPMLMRPEYWDGSVTCGPDLATMLIETRAGEVPAAEPGTAITVTFPEGAWPGTAMVLAEARDKNGFPVGEGGEMVTLEEELADGVLTFTLPEFENNPSCTGILINIAWGENTAWYAAAFQTGPEDPEGTAVDSPSLAGGGDSAGSLR